MPATRVSRWGMRYFAVALASFLLAQAWMAAGLTWPFRPLGASTTLVAVHLLTLGWLSTLMLGALHQFVPVITARPLGSERAAGWTLGLVAGGLLLMLAGFLACGAGAWPLALALPLGGLSVTAGAWLAAAQLGRTLASARPLPLPGRYVAAGLLFLALVPALGVALALAVAAPRWTGPAAAGFLFARGLPLHLLAGLGGWFTLTAMGVALKLLAMFMLAPEERGRRGELAFALTAGGLALAWLSGWGGGWAAAPEELGQAAAAAGAALYLADLARLYGQRRRKRLELNAAFAAWALAALGLEVLALVLARLAGSTAAWAPVLVQLVLFGWLSGLGLSQMIKIVPFLTWIERYGPLMGRTPVPRVQELVDEGRARPWFFVYFAAAATGVAAAAGLVATGGAAAPGVAGALLGGVWRAAALAQLLGAAGVGRELLRVRRMRPAVAATAPSTAAGRP
ncbi:MAG: hypothetical protein QJR08_01795 [Bacillota bacterium]|nr:hypothetical protein [Bacillota bacterium]